MPEPARYDDQPFSAAYLARIEKAFGIVLRTRPVERFMPWRGHQIHIDDWSPLDGRKGTVVLVHGGGGHGRLLAPFAEPLAMAGYHVLAPDLPGYGLSVTRPAWRPDYAEWVELVAALASDSAQPTFTYGLSVGGITALRAAQQATGVRGVVVTTLIDMSDPDTFIHGARTRLLGRAALWGFAHVPGLMDRLMLPLASAMPLRTLTTDDEIADLFVRDPLIGRRRVPAGFFHSMVDYRPAQSDYTLPCPLLLVHPGADTWTPTAMSLGTFEKVTSPKQFVELSNGAHAPLERPAYDELNQAILRFLGEAAAETTRQS